MKNEYLTIEDFWGMRPSIVDLAREILEMHSDKQRLQREVEYLTAVNEQLNERINESMVHTRQALGQVFTAALDSAFVEKENKDAV